MIAYDLSVITRRLTMWVRRPAGQMLLVFLLSFLVKAVFILIVSPYILHLNPYRSADQGLTIAENLLAGRGFSFEFWGLDYQSFRMPLSPLLLAGVLTLFGKSMTAILLSQAVIGSTTALLTYLIARRLFDQRIALIAGVLSALSPAFTYYSGFVFQESLATPLLATAILFLLRAHGNRKLKEVIVAGGFMGLVALARTTFLAFPAAVGIWLLLTGHSVRRVVRDLFILAVGIGLLLVPWVMRNYLVHHRLLLSTTDGGFVFYVWSSPGALQDAKLLYPEFIADRERYQGRWQMMNEVDRNSWFYQQRLATIKADPWPYLQKLLVRLWYIWKPSPYEAEERGISDFLRILPSLVFYVPVYACFALGVYVSRSRWRDLSLLYLLMVYVSCTIPLFGGIIRVRVPIEPYVFIIASRGFVGVVKWLQPQRKALQS